MTFWFVSINFLIFPFIPTQKHTSFWDILWLWEKSIIFKINDPYNKRVIFYFLICIHILLLLQIQVVILHYIRFKIQQQENRKIERKQNKLNICLSLFISKYRFGSCYYVVIKGYYEKDNIMWLHGCYVYVHFIQHWFGKIFSFPNVYRWNMLVSCRNDVVVVAKGWYFSLLTWCRIYKYYRENFRFYCAKFMVYIYGENFPKITNVCYLVGHAKCVILGCIIIQICNNSLCRSDWSVFSAYNR